MGVVALIPRQVVGVKNAGDGEACALLPGGEKRRHPHRDAAIVVDGFDRALGRIAGGDRRRQHQDVLTRDHGGGIFPEKKLAADRVFRRDHIDGLVGVHVDVPGLGQFAGHAGAQDLGAVQAKDGIHDRRVGIGPYQFRRGGACFRKTALGHRHINIIVDVAVACDKVTFADAQQKVGFSGGQFYKIHCH